MKKNRSWRERERDGEARRRWRGIEREEARVGGGRASLDDAMSFFYIAESFFFFYKSAWTVFFNMRAGFASRLNLIP